MSAVDKGIRTVSLTVTESIEMSTMPHGKRKQTERQTPAQRQLKFPDYLMLASIDIKVNRLKVPRGFA